MAHEMFAAVVDSSISVGTKKWYMLPLSILGHVAAIVGLVVVPLVAMDGLPTPDAVIVFVPPEPPKLTPTPPPPAKQPNEALTPPVTTPINLDAAPLVAPTVIIDEPPPARLMPPGGVPGGIPGGIANVGASTLAAAPPPQVVRPGGDIKAPRKVHDARPIYPQVAMAAKVEGIVTIEATISRDGTIVDARVTGSQPLLDQAALDAVRQWKFTPTLLNGVPVEVIMTVKVNFTLR